MTRDDRWDSTFEFLRESGPVLMLIVIVVLLASLARWRFEYWRDVRKATRQAKIEKVARDAAENSIAFERAQREARRRRWR